MVYGVAFYYQFAGVHGLRSELGRLRSDMNLRLARLDQKFDVLTNKVVDIDHRLIRAEERLSLDQRSLLNSCSCAQNL